MSLYVKCLYDHNYDTVVDDVRRDIAMFNPVLNELTWMVEWDSLWPGKMTNSTCLGWIIVKIWNINRNGKTPKHTTTKKPTTVFSKCLFRLFVLCVSCCSKNLFLYGPFCHSALKLDISTLFATFFLWTSFIILIYIPITPISFHICILINTILSSQITSALHLHKACCLSIPCFCWIAVHLSNTHKTEVN